MEDMQDVDMVSQVREEGMPLCPMLPSVGTWYTPRLQEETSTELPDKDDHMCMESAAASQEGKPLLRPSVGTWYTPRLSKKLKTELPGKGGDRMCIEFNTTSQDIYDCDDHPRKYLVRNFDALGIEAQISEIDEHPSWKKQRLLCDGISPRYEFKRGITQEELHWLGTAAKKPRLAVPEDAAMKIAMSDAGLIFSYA
eukprot:gnl/MRDRNA2_/MRDRNA2_124347_c0_seq1.p1 gnl/MRDRNA2_/MRDRNA2_124347_c0~~gnl/MRDRNA2_/MRDRNA2_124347_c0_seq1.p1  ORF type:complete len:197 (-),score=36.07 gnl/MRDRNA2_/MRDRNA2_124347_c0_seq1:160-750(-)